MGAFPLMKAGRGHWTLALMGVVLVSACGGKGKGGTSSPQMKALEFLFFELGACR